MQSSTVKTRQQIATEYGICVKTLKKWLKKHDLTIPAGLVTPRDQTRIYEILGYPPNM
jgi:transposase-like protein